MTGTKPPQSQDWNSRKHPRSAGEIRSAGLKTQNSKMKLTADQILILTQAANIMGAQAYEFSEKARELEATGNLYMKGYLLKRSNQAEIAAMEIASVIKTLDKN